MTHQNPTDGVAADWLAQEPAWRAELIRDIADAADITNGSSTAVRRTLDVAAAMCSIPAMHEYVRRPQTANEALATIHARIAAGELDADTLERLLCCDPQFAPRTDLTGTAHRAEDLAAVADALRAQGLDEQEGTVHSWRCYTRPDQELIGDCDCMIETAKAVLDALAAARGAQNDHQPAERTRP